MKTKRLDSPSFVVALALAGTFLFGSQLRSFAQSPVTWIPTNHEWNYYQADGAPAEQGGTRWYEQGYDDSSWSRGRAELGFTEGDEMTLLERGFTTYYFRTTLTNITAAQLLTNNFIVTNLLRDDGAVMYINGEEVRRDNLPNGEITYDTLAIEAVSGPTRTQHFRNQSLLRCSLVASPTRSPWRFTNRALVAQMSAFRWRCSASR